VNFVDGNQKIQADCDRALLPRLRGEKIAVGRWPDTPALNCDQKQGLPPLSGNPLPSWHVTSGP